MPADSHHSNISSDELLAGLMAELNMLTDLDMASMRDKVAQRMHAVVQDHLDETVESEVQRRVDAEVQKRVAAEVQRQVATQVAHHVQEILEQVRLNRHRMFAASSEALDRQSRLFDEVEQELLDAVDETSDETEESADAPDVPASRSRRPRRGQRRPLPASLPRVEHVIDVPEAERQCDCGTPMVRIGEETSERLDIVPMKIRVIRTIRPRYGCPKGEHAPTTAPAASTVLPRSQFSAGLLATLLVVKYADGLPLNRFAKVLKRHGVDVPRQSLARAVIATSKALQPLYNLAQDTLLDAAVIHMDETPVQVLKEPDKPPTSRSTMWVRRGGPPQQPVILFDYDASRSRQVPMRLLDGWRGHLMTDDYAGHNEVARRDGVVHLACMAHARRKFVDAQRAQSQHKRNKTGRVDMALRYFARLYAIEKRRKDTTPDARYRARQQHSVPVLDELKAWLDKTRPHITPRSKLGEALNYLHDIWPRLVRYTERGDLPIDNNPCENAIRPFVVGRKGWLFADTPAGSHASAVIYSLIETAKANHQEPYAWLRYVLERLPLAKTAEDMETLMPWNLHAH